jgi:uncharacterized membrane protein YtjA (UPF0391 family)
MHAKERAEPSTSVATGVRGGVQRRCGKSSSRIHAKKRFLCGHYANAARQRHFEESNVMLHYAIVFLVIALIAAVLGFGGIAGAAAGIAKILFLVFLVLFVVSLVIGRRRPPV